MKPSDVVFDDNIKNRDKFGIYLKNRRIELDLSLRDFAKMINVSPTYISDIENGNRLAPINYIKETINILQIEKSEIDYFYDLVGCSHSNWIDINDYLSKNPNARRALRLARDKNISDANLYKLIMNMINSSRQIEDENERF